MVPTWIRGTRAASAVSVLHDSSMAPSRSLVFGMKWSVTQATSQPVASRCRHSSSTPDHVWAPMLVNRPKRIVTLLDGGLASTGPRPPSVAGVTAILAWTNQEREREGG